MLFCTAESVKLFRKSKYCEFMQSTKLIKLSDGILIEVEVPAAEAAPASGASVKPVEKAIGVIKPLLIRVAQPVHEAVMDIRTTMLEKNAELEVENAELEINLGFTAEGNVYVTKLQSNSSLKVKLVLKPKD